MNVVNLHGFDEYWKAWEESRLTPDEKVERYCEENDLEGYGYLKAELESCRDLHGNLVEHLKHMIKDKRYSQVVRDKLEELVQDWGYLF